MCRSPSPAHLPARLQHLLSLLCSRACLPCLRSLPPELQHCAAMNIKRDRSDSMAEEPTWHTVEPSSLSDLLEMPSQFQPGSPSCCTCFNILYFGSLSQQTHIQISHPNLNKSVFHHVSSFYQALKNARARSKPCSTQSRRNCVTVLTRELNPRRARDIL